MMKKTNELEARINVAAAHQLAVLHRLNEGVWNHISFESPVDSDCIIITPGHTHWSQVTASNLALMNSNGEMLSGVRPPIKAGWIIHNPIHKVRSDAKCLIHIHSPYINAMSIRSDILFETRSSQQAASFHNNVAYYELYDGLLNDEEEGENMAKVLGDNRVLILRNHGALIAAPTVAQAYIDIYQLERACMYQLLAIAGGGKMQLIPEDIVKKMGQDSMNDRNVKHFEGMKRWLDEVKPIYMK